MSNQVQLSENQTSDETRLLYGSNEDGSTDSFHPYNYQESTTDTTTNNCRNNLIRWQKAFCVKNISAIDINATAYIKIDLYDEFESFRFQALQYWSSNYEVNNCIFDNLKLHPFYAVVSTLRLAAVETSDKLSTQQNPFVTTLANNTQPKDNALYTPLSANRWWPWTPTNALATIQYHQSVPSPIFSAAQNDLIEKFDTRSNSQMVHLHEVYDMNHENGEIKIGEIGVSSSSAALSVTNKLMEPRAENVMNSAGEEDVSVNYRVESSSGEHDFSISYPMEDVIISYPIDNDEDDFIISYQTEAGEENFSKSYLAEAGEDDFIISYPTEEDGEDDFIISYPTEDGDEDFSISYPMESGGEDNMSINNRTFDEDTPPYDNKGTTNSSSPQIEDMYEQETPQHHFYMHYRPSGDTSINEKYTGLFGIFITQAVVEEARYVALCALYISQQEHRGYPRIRVLTSCDLQKHLITSILSLEVLIINCFVSNFYKVKVGTIQEYNSELDEQAFTIVSLSTPNDGYNSVRVDNIYHALQKSNYGVLIIGRPNTNQVHHKWNEVARLMKQRRQFGDQVKMICPTHGVSFIIDNTVQSFDKISSGGCFVNCNHMRPCGHTCKESCHSISHDNVPCMEMTEHKLPCGHNFYGTCHDLKMQELGYAFCQESCERFLYCGYECLEMCGANHSHSRSQCT